jgi:RNA polymerase sigma-70 factor (ECF subfamily)
MRPDDKSDNLTSPSPLTDAEVYQAVKSGQKAALGILYDRYGKLVYGLALKILNNPQEAEDLTQEIFVALWRDRSYNPSRGSLGSFLMTVTRSRSIDKLRSRKTSLKFLDRWSKTMSVETTNTPFEQASFSERSQQVRHALTQLSQEQRQVLEMVYFEGLSQSEIAQQLSLPLGTVKTRSRLGLLKLRQALEDFIR